jgi:hypothetical protein
MAVLQVEQRIRNTGRGSDYFGVCECCGDDVATTHVREERTRGIVAPTALRSGRIGTSSSMAI